MFLIICMTVVVSLFLYRSVMIKEKENCWALLKESSESVTKEMQTTFTGDINLLRLAADTVKRDVSGKIDTEELEQYCRFTTFSRVDVLYPGNRIARGNDKNDRCSDGKRSRLLFRPGKGQQ